MKFLKASDFNISGIAWSRGLLVRFQHKTNRISEKDCRESRNNQNPEWDTRFLQQQIKNNIADHFGVMPSNFGVAIKDSRDAITALTIFKDEYLLDFINTEKNRRNRNPRL